MEQSTYQSASIAATDATTVNEAQVPSLVALPTFTPPAPQRFSRSKASDTVIVHI